MAKEEQHERIRKDSNKKDKGIRDRIIKGWYRRKKDKRKGYVGIKD